MKKFVLILLTILVTLAVLEAFLKFVGFSRSALVWHWVANYPSVYVLDSKNIYRPVQSYEILPTRAKNQPIALFVGDSFTYGNNAETDQSYPYFLKGILPEYSILNAGVPGYGPDQGYNVILDHLEMLSKDVGGRPNILVWNINVNDIFDAEEIPVYKIQNGKLKSISGKINYIYLQGVLRNYLPKPVYESHLLTLALISYRPFSQRLLYNQSVNLARQKIVTEIDNIIKLSEENEFLFMLTLVPSQSQFAEVEEPYLKTDDEIIRQLLAQYEGRKSEHFLYINLNKEIKTNTNTNVLGASANQNIDWGDKLFLKEEKVPVGARHLNREGNISVANIVVEKLKTLLDESTD